jgi:hypothetical protein
MSHNDNIDYEHKYKKYKTKYLELRRNANIKELDSLGNPRIKGVLETYDGYRVPYHEELIESVPESLITKDPAGKSQNKILVIDNINSFDIFTKLYAKEVFDKKYMYVRWERVASKFMGFYIDRSNKELYLLRHDMHNYKDREMFDSWWLNYDILNVVMFDKY